MLVIEPLRELLAELGEADRKPANDPILCGPKGRPLDLNMLAKRVIQPARGNRKNFLPPARKAGNPAWEYSSTPSRLSAILRKSAAVIG